MVCGLLQGRPDFIPDEAALAAEDGDQLVKSVWWRCRGRGGGWGVCMQCVENNVMAVFHNLSSFMSCFC